MFHLTLFDPPTPTTTTLIYVSWRQIFELILNLAPQFKLDRSRFLIKENSTKKNKKTKKNLSIVSRLKKNSNLFQKQIRTVINIQILIHLIQLN